MAQVNPIAPRPQFEGASEIMQAIALARDIFGKSGKEEDKMKIRQLELAEQKHFADMSERFIPQTEEEAIKHGFGGLQLPDDSRQALGLPLRQGQVYIPRADIMARNQDLKAKEAISEAARKHSETLEEQIRKDLASTYSRDQTVESAKAAQSAFRTLESAVKTDKPGGPSDLAIINSFARVVEPRLASTKGEKFDKIEGSGGYFDNLGMTAIAERVRSGAKLDPSSRDAIYREAKKYMLGHLELEQSWASSVRRQIDALNAQGRNLNPETIVDGYLSEMYSRLKQDIENDATRSQSGQLISQGQSQQKGGMFNFLMPSAQADTPFDPTSFIKK